MPVLPEFARGWALGEITADAEPRQWLLCRVGDRICALPILDVVETMRALPITPLTDPLGPVCGASIIRGVTVPVVDAGALFSETRPSRRRFVTIDLGGRVVALAVDEVLGITDIADDVTQALPPLLREGMPEAVRTIGVRDGEFLLRLETARLVSAAVLDALTATVSTT
jgi:purine-binding chemotaxis protein CheW